MSAHFTELRVRVDEQWCGPTVSSPSGWSRPPKPRPAAGWAQDPTQRLLVRTTSPTEDDGKGAWQ
ncbi:hypothetical protein GCM10010145_46930 [Streptomyces ruber]|uniref:Uncharacterized protein n=2 Tax=Streptomyces TaxID=1883 RepID=A0A918BJU5_9ACTN|nr:hypothetical protein GCM10010145_46930 [Streptomyces ruber]